MTFIGDAVQRVDADRPFFRAAIIANREMSFQTKQAWQRLNGLTASINRAAPLVKISRQHLGFKRFQGFLFSCIDIKQRLETCGFKD